MNLELAIQRLTSDCESIRALVVGVSPEQACWRPASDKWSILEVVNHLYDEECLDFRTRLNHILSGAAPPWPALDPQGRVLEQKYNERDLAESLDNFLRERGESLVWLKGLPSTDWEAAYNHPSRGPLTAGAMLASWVAHDLLHIRQLAKLHYQYLSVAFEGRNIDYAGELT
jgi:hypothetical protein